MLFSEREALSFYKRFIDDNINEECYGESCNFDEVVEKYDNTEQSVSGVILSICKTKPFVVQSVHI